MVNVSPAVLGFLRGVVYPALFTGLLAILTYFADATHLSGFLNGSLAVLIAGAAGYVEHYLETQGQGALFGAVRRV